MKLKNTQTSTVIRSFLIGGICLLITAGTALNVAAETSGYVSPSSADLPPSMDRDVASRSTDPNLPPAYGPDDAKVLVITFADYRCPACLRASQATHRIAAEFPGEVRMEFWNHPLPSHKNADLAALAGIAAQQQGRFWEMNDLLFEHHKHDIATLEQHAEELGLDLVQFRSDMNDPGIKERIRKEGALTEALGARNTPSYLVNGKVSMGWGSWRSLVGKVERELKAINESAEKGMDSTEIRSQREFDNFEDSEMYELYRQGVIEPRINATSE